MTRVKRSVNAKKKRRATLEMTKGFRGEANSNYKRAKEALLKADQYRYRDRRNRKRDFRRLWVHAHQRRRASERHELLELHARPQAGRGRARPQDPRRHRRARPGDLPAIRRSRSRRGGGGEVGRRRHHRRSGAASLGTAPFFVSRPVITSHHNPKLQLLRRLQTGRERRRTGLFAAEGEDLLAAADAAGWHEEERLIAGEDVEPDVLARVSALGSGIPRGRRSTSSAGPTRRPGRCASRCGASAIRATSARCCAPRWPSAPPRSRSGRAAPIPTGPRRSARAWASIFAVPLARVGEPEELPGERIALVAREGEPLTGPADGAVSLLVGAEREGLPPDVAAAATPHGAHPDRLGVAQRGDGGDRGALRADPE